MNALGYQILRPARPPTPPLAWASGAAPPPSRLEVLLKLYELYRHDYAQYNTLIWGSSLVYIGAIVVMLAQHPRALYVHAGAAGAGIVVLQVFGRQVAHQRRLRFAIERIQREIQRECAFTASYPSLPFLRAPLAKCFGFLMPTLSRCSRYERARLRTIVADSDPPKMWGMSSAAFVMVVLYALVIALAVWAFVPVSRPCFKAIAEYLEWDSSPAQSARTDTMGNDAQLSHSIVECPP